MSTDGQSYPERPNHFDRSYIRFLDDYRAIDKVGVEGCWLLTVLVNWEDKLRYTGPILAWNKQIQAILGDLSRPAMDRIRKKCIRHGYLAYLPGTKGVKGQYFVTIPPQYAKLFMNASVQESVQKASRKRPESVHHSLPSPIPSPNPPPNPQPADQDQPPDPKRNGSVKSNDSHSKTQPVIDHYRTYHPRSNPGQKERRLILARLKDGYSLEDLKLAIDGCHLSPYHKGENDSGTKYQSLELIFRDSSRVDQFVGIAAEKKPKPVQAASVPDYERWRANAFKRNRGLSEEELEQRYREHCSRILATQRRVITILVKTAYERN